MIVIIEGLDGVGKTTIAKQIEKDYKYEYIHESYTDNVKAKEDRILLMLARLMEDEKYIYDRTTLIDDFVYSFLNKQQSTLSNYQQIIIEILKKCKVIHLELDEKIRKKRFEQRGDEYITSDKIKLIDKQYKQFYKQLPNVQHIELTEDNEKNINEIIRRIEND